MPTLVVVKLEVIPKLCPTTIAGVYQILDTMVEAHGIFVECLYAHIANQ